MIKLLTRPMCLTGGLMILGGLYLLMTAAELEDKFERPTHTMAVEI